jgi:hypothetical protein
MDGRSHNESRLGFDPLPFLGLNDEKRAATIPAYLIFKSLQGGSASVIVAPP